MKDTDLKLRPENKQKEDSIGIIKDTLEYICYNQIHRSYRLILGKCIDFFVLHSIPVQSTISGHLYEIRAL